MTIVYLGLGANLGDRESNIIRALDALTEGGIIISQCSSIYETSPVGFHDQGHFLNIVCRVSTSKSVKELMNTIKGIEKIIGRTASFINGPRDIDIDILLYGREIIHEKAVTVPHPRLHERLFVLAPLIELDPNLLHPVLQKTVAELAKVIDDKHTVRIWKDFTTKPESGQRQ